MNKYLEEILYVLYWYLKNKMKMEYIYGIN